MRYQANPVIVEARRIDTVFEKLPNGHVGLMLEPDSHWENFITATPEMLARMTPVAGDYVVTQDDGYVYLNPRAVFERKYSPADPA